MKNEITTFNNAKFGEVRTLEISNEIWFVGKDVAEILGYGDGNVKSKALTNALADHVDDEDKRHISYSELKGYQNGDLNNFSHYGAIFINESGLYSLVLSSKLPTAKEFKRWVTSEVLPSIRKHGIYATENTIDKVLADPDFGIRLLTELKEERKKNAVLETENAVQKQQIAEMEPKVTYYDLVLEANNTVTTTTISKDYGMSAQELNQILHDNKIQYKQGGIWVLYQKYAKLGLTKTKTGVTRFDKPNGFAYVQTRWTQKGRLFIYDLLKSIGILPLIEQEMA